MCPANWAKFILQAPCKRERHARVSATTRLSAATTALRPLAGRSLNPRRARLTPVRRTFVALYFYRPAPAPTPSPRTALGRRGMDAGRHATARNGMAACADMVREGLGRLRCRGLAVQCEGQTARSGHGGGAMGTRASHTALRARRFVPVYCYRLLVF
ncbi:unnamed protein product, partial [Iphiclides podalirius]